ncbi:MAG: CAP domain-containing protein [Sandaracinaceae bacterium]|nr:CAP domain-containing protein [Sandaracinaceae bacterium]
MILVALGGGVFLSFGLGCEGELKKQQDALVDHSEVVPDRDGGGGDVYELVRDVGERDALHGLDGGPVEVRDAARWEDASGGSIDAGPPAFPEPGRLAGITEAHNHYRARVETSPPLPPLQWDPEIAMVAQAFAEQLRSEGCRTLYHSRNGYGENIFASFGIRVTPERVVGAWFREGICYTPGPYMRGDRCDPECLGRNRLSACGHYTQVVWRRTQRLGCGVASCPSGEEIWVCNYDPPGNVIGQWPY